MRAFQTIFVALSAAAAANGQLIQRSYGLGGLYGSYGSGLNYGGLGYGYGASYAPAVSYGSGYSTIAAAPAISYGGGYSTIAAAPAVAYGGGYSSIAAAPAVSYGSSVVAAPAVSYARSVVAAPAVSTIAAAPVAYAAAAPVAYAAAAPVAYAAAAPVNVGVIAAGGAPTVRSHEIHTGSGQSAIRIEDFQAGDQVIRVHEGPQAGPEVAQVQVPGEQHHIRVINHQSGPAHIERVVSRAQTQVIDLQKPGRPGARIVQVVKGQSPAPSIEFVNAGGSSHHVYYADDLGAGGAVVGGGAIGGGVFHTSYAAPAVGGAVIAAAPAVSTIAAAPAYSTIAAAPAVSYATGVRTIAAAAPAVSYGSSYAPISYGTYGLGGFGYGGAGYGGLGYSTGYRSYGVGNNVYLDAKKKASAKKSA